MPDGQLRGGGARDAAVDEAARVRCVRAKELCDAGDYDAASQALGDFWAGVGARPHVEGLAVWSRAELLLSVGVVSAFLGRARREKGFNETTQDLFAEAARLFAELGLYEKAVEAETELAFAYWRQGAYSEAKDLAHSIGERYGAELSGDARARWLLISAVVERELGSHSAALGLLSEAAELFGASQSAFYKGTFHLERAVCLSVNAVEGGEAASVDRALVEFAAAGYHFQQVGNMNFYGRVENNTGYLLFLSGRYEEAQDHLNRARAIFLRLKDRGIAAQVDDTRAKAYIEVGNYEAALECAASAVQTFEGSDEYGLYVKALSTYATALARAGRFGESVAAFNTAAVVAGERINEREGARVALLMIEELSASVYLKAGVSYKEAVRSLERRLIKAALIESEGSIKAAALKLGLSNFQHLQYILNERHPELLQHRSPIRPARKSIIKDRAKVLTIQEKSNP